MNKLFFLFFTFFTFSISAFEGFYCIPSLRQTRLQILVRDQNIEALVVNPSGYEFMPQFDGAGTAFNLAFNKMQAEDLKNLGDGFAFSWPRDKCSLDSDNFVVNCSGEALSKVQEIKGYGLSTTEITEKYQIEKFEKRRFRFNLEKDNNYFVNIEFYKQNCEKFKGNL